MARPKLSVVIPTRNRPEAVRETLAPLFAQELPAADYEIIVVDDGSTPPLAIPGLPSAPKTTLLGTTGLERSAARNAGAAAAQGDVLLFLDDDITVDARFLGLHAAAQAEWPGAIAVGRIALPPASLDAPFSRFRQRLEEQGRPRERGPVAARNFCTAANMSISRDAFLRLGGFDPALPSGEDQDLALRHTASGGLLVHVPDAIGIHRDVTDLAGYCRRTEWGSEHLVAFSRKHPAWADSVDRERVNGPLRWGREPLRLSLSKLAKAALSSRLICAGLIGAARAVEGSRPGGSGPERLYALLIGLHVFRGYRTGLQRRDSRT